MGVGGYEGDNGREGVNMMLKSMRICDEGNEEETIKESMGMS